MARGTNSSVRWDEISTTITLRQPNYHRTLGSPVTTFFPIISGQRTRLSTGPESLFLCVDALNKVAVQQVHMMHSGIGHLGGARSPTADDRDGHACAGADSNRLGFATGQRPGGFVSGPSLITIERSTVGSPVCTAPIAKLGSALICTNDFEAAFDEHAHRFHPCQRSCRNTGTVPRCERVTPYPHGPRKCESR